MSTSVIVATSYDPAWLAVFEHIVRNQIADGRKAILLDSTELATAPVDSYHRGLLRAFRLPYPGRDIRERMTARGAVYLRSDDVPFDDEDDAPLEPRLEEALDLAIDSALGTYYRTDRPDPSRRRVGRLAHGLRREGRAIYRLVRHLCAADPDIDRVYVPNGRFPSQKLAGLAVEDAGITKFNTEKGERAGRVYVQEYGPHDRLRSQADVERVLEGIADTEVEQIADTWLQRRAGAGGNARFTKLFADGLPPELVEAKQAGRKIAGFFTSSADEFSFLGKDWQHHEWSDQFDSFEAAMTRFEAEGYLCYLRVHPNLASRSHDSFRRERARVRLLAERHPGVVVIWHDATANSYALVEASDAVIVWLSTVGLEASARGHSVWTLSTPYYGNIADVREVLSATELDAADLHAWTVDVHGAKRYVAYLNLRDQDPEPTESWMPWDAERPPLGAKVAAIAVSGGTPGIAEAMRSILDKYRHRRFSANLRALRR